MKRNSDSSQKVWEIYNRLTKSVFTLSDEPTEHSQLQQDIEEKLDTDEGYQRQVKALLESPKVDENLADYFVGAHQKEGERQKYQKDQEKKRILLEANTMAVYNMLKESVFTVSEDANEQSALQWEIERRLSGTGQVDRLYQRKVSELLPSDKSADEQLVQSILDDQQRSKTPVASSSVARAFSDNVVHSSSDGGKKPSRKLTDEEKWYFTDVHHKYEERHTSLKIEENEKIMSYKRFFYRIKNQYKRQELKEKMQQRKNYEQDVKNFTKEYDQQMMYLTGKISPKTREEKMAIVENVLQSIVHYEVNCLTSVIKARASSRVNQLESEKIDMVSAALHSTAFSMWTNVATSTGTNTLGQFLGNLAWYNVHGS